MAFEVTDNVPPPGKRSGKYPFREMTVGSGFNLDTSAERDRAQSAAINYTKTPHGAGKRFSTGKHGAGYRIWRVL